MTSPKLQALHDHVHNAVRGLKMGETGEIECTREFPVDDIQNYLRGYALHKGKWFDTTTDLTSRRIFVKRAPPAPWELPSTFDPEEEP
jgi:hypothetical protein